MGQGFIQVHGSAEAMRAKEPANKGAEKGSDPLLDAQLDPAQARFDALVGYAVV